MALLVPEQPRSEMSDHDHDVDEDPAEVEPTDNSSGAPVDLDLVHDLEEQQQDEPLP
jgi:hypothetical protein